MPRARRTWGDIKAEIRDLLRETVAANSFWDDDDLLAYVNQSIDLRAMELGERFEGWITDEFSTDIVAGQREYTLPEGTGRIVRTLLVRQDGNNTLRVPLIRNERISDITADLGTSAVASIGNVPTYRLVGNLLYLEPTPQEAITDGLVLELESVPSRVPQDDSAKLDLRFPDVMETLVIYDAWDLACGVEDSMGNVDPAAMGRLSTFHRKYERAFANYTAKRSHGRVFSHPYYLGD